MNRFFTLLLAASCMTAVGQSCCDQDSNLFSPGPCITSGEAQNWAVDGAVCDPDCADYDVCVPGSECYDPSDPSCEIPGCTYPQACNYDADATVYNGSCFLLVHHVMMEMA